MSRMLYVYAYADVLYDDAVAILSADAAGFLQEATDVSVVRADEVHARLHVPLAGFELARDVVAEVGAIEAVDELSSRMSLRWHAAHSSLLFPSVTAHLELTALALSPPETQVTLVGSYEPPLGLLGEVGDRAGGHVLAEAAVKHFVDDVAARLSSWVPATSD